VPVRDTQTDTQTRRQTNSAENKDRSGLQSGQKSIEFFRVMTANILPRYTQCIMVLSF